ncbi:MAG: hypothetical protein HY059_03330 [Proteobacteria bacterium]|nr:hypothetical protein [Pseudomonadota bacterium]
MRVLLISVLVLALAACATQRYGRLSPLSEFEKQNLNCREISFEVARAEEFLSQTQSTRSGMNAAHVFGILGDLGIGNALEGSAAEQSGQVRLKELKEVAARRAC